MKAYLKLILLLFSACLYAQGQTDLKIHNMKTPNAPGFQILDISPSLVEKPSNPKEFTASLMSLSNSGSVLPKNFAMEISPFWFVGERGSISKYLNIRDENKKSNAFSGILRKLSVSLASTYNDSTSGSLLEKTNYLAVGIRTNIITLRTEKQSEVINQALKNYDKRVNFLKAPKDELNLELSKLLQGKSDLEDQLKLANVTEEKKKEINKNIELLETEISDVEIAISNFYKLSADDLDKKMEADDKIKEYYKVMEQEPMFQLDAAFAYSDAYKDNKSENKRFNRSGVWVTGTFNFSGFDNINKDDRIALLFTGRYINDNVLKDSIAMNFQKEKALDLGFKLEYKIKKLTIGIEHLKRKYNGGIDIELERTVGILQYQMSEDLYFVGSYGKNFGEVNNLFTLFGINYGFGSSTLKPEE